MNVAAFMDEMASKLAGLEGLNVAGWEEKSIRPPALLVPFPPISYDRTYGRGSDSIDFELTILVGHHNARSSRNELAAYASGSGPRSVKRLVDSGPTNQYTSADEVTISSFDPDVIRVGDVDFLGGVFKGTATGAGSVT